MKKIFIIIVSFFLFSGLANADRDKSGEFSFTPIDGWKVSDSVGNHSMLENNNLKVEPKGNITFIELESKSPLPMLLKGVENDVCNFNINYINSIIYIEKISV